MKRTLLLGCVILILSVLTFGRTYLVAQDCPSTTVVGIPVWADPNQVNYDLMNVFEAVVNQQIVKRVWACDPEGNDIVFSVSNSDISVIQTDPNEADIVWTPASVGIYYVDIKAVDEPAAGQPPMEDNGSVIYRVNAANTAPIFGGCR